MFQKDKWPFIPTCLGDLIDRDTLSVIQSGCCERLGRPLIIFDGNPQTKQFSNPIEAINLRQRFESFCSTFREQVEGGEQACRRCNLENAGTSQQEFEQTGTPFRTFECHLGLQEATYVIKVERQPVALLYSGQYLPPDGISALQQRVSELGTGHYAHLQVGDDARQKLSSLAEKLPTAPPDLCDLLRREAEHIQRLAEAKYSQDKYQWEQRFLDMLRTPASSSRTAKLDHLRQDVRGLLEQIRTFCRCDYVVFFASVQESDTVLAPIAGIGIPPEIEKSLPHFNWRKADLPLEHLTAKVWDTTQWCQTARTKGIRGDNNQYFVGASCLMPTSLGDRYRGALVFGPFAEVINREHEKRFLLDIASAVSSFALVQLELRHLEQERKRWSSAASLLLHQLNTALTPITTLIGRAKLVAYHHGNTQVVEMLKRSEDLSLRLRDSARRTLRAHTLHQEAEDFEFEEYPLSVLVANGAEGFILQANERHRTLTLDPSIELLPEAQVDVARLTIGLGNLLENAIKYSFPNTEIKVRSSFQPVGQRDTDYVILEVESLGDEIKAEDRTRIFEQGTRGLIQAKMGRIPGSGLGLWETRAVVDAHGGEIGVTCQKTNIRRPQGIAYRVIFSLKIPLVVRQAKRGG